MSSDRWKTVWITGASTGIGRELACRLAGDGTVVAVSARSADKLNSLASDAASIHAFPLDVTDATAAIDSCASIEQQLGPIDLAILAAGTYRPGPFTDLDADDFATTVQVNYLGVINALAAVLPGMLKRGRGHVAIVASVAGYRGLPRAASYGPTKAALINLAESIRPELAARGVTVSLVNPGFVRTPMTEKNDFEMPFLMEPEEAARRILSGLAAGRYEIAFPTRLVAVLKLLRILPNALFFWAVRNTILRNRR